MKAKLISIAVVILLLVLALMQISGVVHDRQTYRQMAIDGIARSLAGPQTLTGPLIHRACTKSGTPRSLINACKPSGANFI